MEGGSLLGQNHSICCPRIAGGMSRHEAMVGMLFQDTMDCGVHCLELDTAFQCRPVIC